MAEDSVISDPLDRKCKLRTLNEMITCKICHGYLVDATTVTECLHTFCKSCIVKHLEDSNECPECEDIIHQSHPLDYISYDRTLQDLVYKIVPGNFEKNLAKNLSMSRKAKYFVKVCLHSSKAVQISLQFHEFFDKKFQNLEMSRMAKNFVKVCLHSSKVV